MRQSVFVSAALLTVAGFMCFAGDARAQDAAPGTPAAPAGAPAAPAAAGAPQADTHANAAGDEKEEGRLRIGFNFLNAGIGSAGDLSGPFIGATFKIGWQFNRLIGLYGNITPFVWIGSSSAPTAPGAASVDIGAIAGTQLTPLFSLSPADIFEIAAGPSLDYLSGGGTSSSAAGGATVGGFSGVYFGAHGKLALHLGGRNEETGRRKGFTIEGNIHPSFTPGNAALFMTGGLGYDWM